MIRGLKKCLFDAMIVESVIIKFVLCIIVEKMMGAKLHTLATLAVYISHYHRLLCLGPEICQEHFLVTTYREGYWRFWTRTEGKGQWEKEKIMMRFWQLKKL